MVHPICAATLAISYQSNQVTPLVRFWRRSTTGHADFSFIKTAVAPFSCAILLIFWTNLSNSKSQEQSEQRIVKLGIEPSDQANASRKGIITPDPNFQNSILKPALSVDQNRFLKLPHSFFVNLIDTPNHGPNVYMGFYRLWNQEELCISVPSHILLTAKPRLLNEVKPKCTKRTYSIPRNTFRPLTKIIYSLTWIGTMILLLFSLLQVFLKKLDSAVLAVPLIFISIYSVLQVQENRYGAPGLPILLFLGCFYFLGFSREHVKFYRSRFF